VGTRTASIDKKCRNYVAVNLSIQVRINARRGIQKVRRLTQLVTRYLHHILSLFQIAICHANNIVVVGKFASFHDERTQKVS